MLLPRGSVSFVSQSGTLGEYFYNATQQCGFGVSKFVSCGNQARIAFNDILEYLGDDPSTRVITGYVEDVGDGRRFLEIARKVADKKPLLLFKAGSTPSAARACLSHTAAIAGNDDIFDAACRQAGVIRWHNFMEMFAMVDALSHQPHPKGKPCGSHIYGWRVLRHSCGGLYEAGYGIACNELRGSEKRSLNRWWK